MWKIDYGSKLKPMSKTMPIFIIWQIWKKKERYKKWREIRMNRTGMVREINKNIYLMTISRYPSLIYVSNSWHWIIYFFEFYAPIISCKVIK